MKIYVVIGTTGEYSDRSEWLVKAFTEEPKAQDLILKATERAKELEVTLKHRWDLEEGMNEHDPNMQLDYTGTSYYYEEVELE